MRLIALSQWHVQQGFLDPVATLSMHKALKGIMRSHGKPKKKAKALSVEDLFSIVEKLSAIGTLKAMCDSASLQIGYFGGIHRSEVAGLQVQDLAWELAGLVIKLPRSKTDQEGLGIVKAIPYRDDIYCPVTSLRIWLDAAGIRDGAVSRPFTRWQILSDHVIHPASINTILAECGELAGLDNAPEFSSHSFRRDMATSAHRAGADFRDIKRQGGWRHDGTVRGYVEEANRFENNVVCFLWRRKPV